MTREEAAKICQSIKFILDNDDYSEEVEEALDMAIEALEQEQSEIIRCKNCRHDNNCEIQYSAQAGSKFFCGFAEKRGSDGE